MSLKKTVYPPERTKTKIMVDLPKDQIAMIDGCAKAMGMSRSGFLQIIFDAYSEKITDFVETWLFNVKYWTDEVHGEKRLANAKKAAEALGMTLQKQPKA